MRNTKDRFEAKYIAEPNSGCWLWEGAVGHNGHGKFRVNNTTAQAHRVSYELFVGNIPTKMQVNHTCDVSSCVNPDHLYVGTQAENMRDAATRGRSRNQNDYKTHCKHGHEFTEENTHFRPQGGRTCRACKRAYYHRTKNKRENLR